MQPSPAAQLAQPGCPSVVTLVARGSEENDFYPPSASNGHADGYEGEIINRYLDYATSVHPDLFDADDRPVRTVGPDYYPARFPVGEAGEDIDLAAVATAVGGVGHFIDSMARGLPGGLQAVSDYEDATGCAPDYVTVGYSQGVAVLAPVQQKLAAEGRLRGVITLGSPFHRAPELVTGGFVADVPTHDYCLPDDFVCDTGVRSVALALADDEDAGAHADYFRTAAQDPADALAGDRAAVDALADYLS